MWEGTQDITYPIKNGKNNNICPKALTYVLVYQRTAGRPLVLKKCLEDRSIQDLKIVKRTSKDLFFNPGTIISMYKERECPQ